MDFLNVKSLMIGGKPVAKLLIGGRIAWQKAKPEPEPVVEGAYIETDGTSSYMDLAFVPTASMTYKIDFLTYLQGGIPGYVMGASAGWSIRYMLGNGDGDGHVIRSSNPTWENLLDADEGRHVVEYTGDFAVDGVTVATGLNARAATRTMILGHDGRGVKPSRTRYYGMQIWESGVLIRDLVPYSGPRGVGLLDRVHDVLYTNAGGGSLTYGVESQLPEDRLEVTFDLGIDASVGEAAIPIACRNWPLDGRFVGTAYYGIGDPYEFEQEAALVGRTWKQFTNYSGDALPDRGEYTRWIYGVGGIQLNFGYILFTAPAKKCIKFLRIPTYAVMNTCTGSFPNCSDITFVGRSRAEAVAMHAGMQSAFASATWHCTDGDYVGGAE